MITETSAYLLIFKIKDFGFAAACNILIQCPWPHVSSVNLILDYNSLWSSLSETIQTEHMQAFNGTGCHLLHHF